MRTLVKPDLVVKDVYETCISKVRNKALKMKLLEISYSIEAAELEYKET